MRVLIGTPIHEVKDYSMERWLANVARVVQKYPADLLMVDNSPSLKYAEKARGYCVKFGIASYEIKHLEIAQGQDNGKSMDEQIHERVARCREIIRQEVLAKDYDAWFSWECDQLIPDDGLGKLAGLLKAGNFMVVDHNCWTNDGSNMVNFDFGVSLFSRQCLQKYGFLTAPGGSNAPESWFLAEDWYRKRLKKDGCKFTEVEGLIEPVYHI